MIHRDDVAPIIGPIAASNTVTLEFPARAQYAREDEQD